MIKKILAASLLLGGFACGGETALEPVPAVAAVPAAYWAVPVQQDVYRATVGTRIRWAIEDRHARLAARTIAVAPLVQPIAVQPVVVQPMVVRPVLQPMFVWRPICCY